MTDVMVQETQKWLNATYRGKQGYSVIREDGQTGWTTIYALLHALQIELGITATADAFGPGTQSRFMQRWPGGIVEQNQGAATTNNVYGIIQGALWCKGYSTGASTITRHFYGGTGDAIRALKNDMGIGGDSKVTLDVMKALLSMDQYTLLIRNGGKASIRSIQQQINKQYHAYTGIIPADGRYGREMNTALIQVLQSLEGYTPEDATGNFGDGTTANLRVITPNNAGAYPQWLWLITAALTCNGYDVKSQGVWTCVKAFQRDYALPVTGIVDKSTWMSLLISCGDPNRSAKACDCATVLNAQQANDLRRAGFTHVGRYLTGTVGVGANRKSKALTREEVANIRQANLSVFPIYQDGGYYPEYFSSARQGAVDAYTAMAAAQKMGFPKGTIIYFAVDFDAYGYQIDDLIIPYFEQVSMAFKNSANKQSYRVGVYAPRLVCEKLDQLKYAQSSFVADMSRGFAGNLGYSIPKNWAFDQFHEYTFGSSPSFAIDKDAYSGRDTGTKTLIPVDEKTEKEISQSSMNSIRMAATDAFAREVIQPLGIFTSLISIDWGYERTMQVQHITTPDYDVDVELKVSSSVQSNASEDALIHVKTDSSGKLDVSTENEIRDLKASFDVPGVGSDFDFRKLISSIGTSVKSGNISFTTTFSSPAEFSFDISVTSENLLPDGTDGALYAEVVVSYSFTLHPQSHYHFQLPDISLQPMDNTLVSSLVGALMIIIAAGSIAAFPQLLPLFGVLV
ncbi:glycoside hydrolase domain-containing protein [Alloscardovia macacae]|uniref:Peptidoglycan-binding protein n=1 Tax=Alloscardovia macacae TaxID=1160091 RepID=A0A261F7J8_9BIFI|nr:glycoside hydrolase domain-containing protein [Alloscardovia macacae]OZG54856.1 peptidoglycan-binding protein [Alloscardovia macacae]